MSEIPSSARYEAMRRAESNVKPELNCSLYVASGTRDIRTLQLHERCPRPTLKGTELASERDSQTQEALCPASSRRIRANRSATATRAAPATSAPPRSPPKPRGRSRRWTRRCGIRSSGATTGSDTVNTVSADDEIDALFAEWKSAMSGGAVVMLLSLITEDAEFWTHGAAPVKGRDAVRALFIAFFDTVSMRQDLEEIERLVDGDISFVRGFETNTLTPTTGDGTVEVRQRAFMLLRRTDGQWRFARGMTNREQ